MRNKTVKFIVKTAVLSAAAFLIMLLEFPLWFAPPFYELDLSEIVVLIGGFSMGPLAAVLIEGLKILLNLALTGTITGGIGEIANFVIGCSFVLPAVLLYRAYHTRKAAIAGMAAGTLTLTLLGSAANAFVLLPLYARIMGLPIDAFVGMGAELNSAVTDLRSFIFFIVAPFNLLKGASVSLLTLLIYKRISPLLKR